MKKILAQIFGRLRGRRVEASRSRPAVAVHSSIRLATTSGSSSHGVPPAAATHGLLVDFSIDLGPDGLLPEAEKVVGKGNLVPWRRFVGDHDYLVLTHGAVDALRAHPSFRPYQDREPGRVGPHGYLRREPRWKDIKSFLLGLGADEAEALGVTGVLNSVVPVPDETFSEEGLRKSLQRYREIFGRAEEARRNQIHRRNCYPETPAKEMITSLGGKVTRFQNCRSATCNCVNHPRFGVAVTFPAGTLLETGGVYILPNGRQLQIEGGGQYDFPDLIVVV